MAVASPVGCSNQFSCSFLSNFNSTLSACRCVILNVRYTYALNKKGLKAGSVYALNKGYALNNGVHLTTRVYGSLNRRKNIHLVHEHEFRVCEKQCVQKYSEQNIFFKKCDGENFPHELLFAIETNANEKKANSGIKTTCISPREVDRLEHGFFVDSRTKLVESSNTLLLQHHSTLDKIEQTLANRNKKSSNNKL